jgi:hypothetical protein
MEDPGASARKVSSKVVVIPIPPSKSMSFVHALPDRTWMNNLEATDQWLPTSIANQAGWIILNDQDIEITWNGGRSPSDLLISSGKVGTSPRAVSQFGNGIATWKLPFLFRLPLEVNLRLRGPTNWHKEGAFPIEQILDAASSIVGVSMSWKVTTIGTPVRFETGEPLCMIYPELQGLADAVDPQTQLADEEIPPRRQVAPPGTQKDSYSVGVKPHERERLETGEVSSLPIVVSFHNGAGPEAESTRVAEDLSFGSKYEMNEPSAISNDRSILEVFRVQDNFYDQAQALREEFERTIASASSTDQATNPLTYAYSQNAYHFLTASAERVFNADLLFSLLDSLRAWARQNLGARHASTPRVQIYVRGSHRIFAKDDIFVGWHYILSLTRGEKHVRKANVILESASASLDSVKFGVSRVERIRLKYNDLLVHDAKRAYGIDGVKCSVNPLEGLVLLGGYLW